MTNLLDVYNKMNFSSNKEDMALNDRVLIVDGFNTFIRSFCAIPTLDDNGNHIGGITGFLRSLGYVIRTINPTRVFVVFDGKGGSKRRRDFYPEYKSNKKPITRLNRVEDIHEEDESELMKRELLVLVSLLTKLPINILVYDNTEADDVIAYLSHLVSDVGGKSIIYSMDKDFLQLVNDQVSVYNPIKKKLYRAQDVVDEYHIHPNNFLIYRAVIGDKSDNIDGIKGVGKKTMLKAYPHLANEETILFDDLVEISSKSKLKSIRKISENSDLLERNRILMQLSDVNISASTKTKIIDVFRDDPFVFDKRGLTQLMVHHNLLGAMSNYHEWVTSTFMPLTRFYD